MKTLNKLTPFKFFALTNFPYIEADFDALTNYELFCKIVEYVNSISASQNDVIDNFNELMGVWNEYKAYIDYIYENLGEYVNDKIDELAENGTLEHIMEPLMPPIINNWLDEHPEATTTVQDGSLTESKFAKSLKDKTIRDYVTPEMYGAIGDGVADDTQAVQDAFDSGKNVCFLLTSQYLITDTITISNITRKGYTAFSECVTRWANYCRIICSFENASHPLFSIEDDGWTFENVSINARNNYDNGVNITVFKTNTTGVDVDFSLVNCAIYKAHTVVNLTGRGLDIQNNVFASCSRLLHINWQGEGETPYHNDETGQRAIVIENNRFHSFSREATSVIYLESGNAFGLRFCNNNFDRGYTSLLKADSGIKDWIIEGNTFHGLGGTGTNDCCLLFSNGIDGLTFCNNSFVNAIESGYKFTNIMEFTNGTYKNIVISGNNFGKLINGSGICVYSTATLDGITIANNVIDSMIELSTQRGLLYLSSGPSATNVTIIGNVIKSFTPASGTTNSVWMVRASGGLRLSYAKIIGNIIYDHEERQLSSSGTDYSSNCLYDWQFTVSS